MEPVAKIAPSEQPEPLMNQRATGAIHRRIVALAFAAWIFDFYDLVLYSFLLVPVARELNLTAEQSALALGTSLLMTALGGVIFGFLGDRFGRKPVIAATVAIYGVGTALCGFSNTLTQLLVFRSITGLGMGGGWGRLPRAGDRMASHVHGFRRACHLRRRRRAELDAGERRLAPHARRPRARLRPARASRVSANPRAAVCRRPA